ncbi:MAG: CBS domain-containing protein [Rhodobiaceae bacterium]|nr:CBS domain-containing protein [Rhodobiaceae bacterium]MCC0055955.1 CBS domain-containing protein [Rhodobiaceae bacterium]
MTAEQILLEKGTSVVTITAQETINSAMQTLAEKRIGAIVVTDSSDRVIGIVSERDVVREIAGRGASALDLPVSAIMTRKVVTCELEDTIGQLMQLMTGGKFRHLPVVVDGRLAGIVSIGDVVKARIEETVREAEAMREYIATA